jgi:hypothetical protein
MSNTQIYNNNIIDKKTDIYQISNLFNDFENKKTYNISNEIFNIKITNRIILNYGIINMMTLNINYIINILSNLEQSNKYILFLSKNTISNINLSLDVFLDEIDITYYTYDNVIIYNNKDIDDLIPLLDKNYKNNNNVRYIIQCDKTVNNDILNIKSNNFIWYLLSNNRYIKVFKQIFDLNIFQKMIKDKYINIIVDKDYIPKIDFDKYLYKQLDKIYKNQFNNFDSKLLKSELEFIICKYNTDNTDNNKDILIFFIIQFNDKYPNYYIDIEQFINDYQCCILYDYPEKLSITKCCNNILDYESCIKYFNQSNKCSICRREFDNIHKHIYVYNKK